jgi:hypothetical protein
VLAIPFYFDRTESECILACDGLKGSWGSIHGTSCCSFYTAAVSSDFLKQFTDGVVFHIDHQEPLYNHKVEVLSCPGHGGSKDHQILPLPVVSLCCSEEDI